MDEYTVGDAYLMGDGKVRFYRGGDPKSESSWELAPEGTLPSSDARLLQRANQNVPGVDRPTRYNRGPRDTPEERERLLGIARRTRGAPNLSGDVGGRAVDVQESGDPVQDDPADRRALSLSALDAMPLGLGAEIFTALTPYTMDDYESAVAQGSDASRAVGTAFGAIPTTYGSIKLGSALTQGMNPVTGLLANTALGAGEAGGFAAATAPTGSRARAGLIGAATGAGLTGLLGGLAVGVPMARNFNSVMRGDPRAPGTPLRQTALADIRNTMDNTNMPTVPQPRTPLDVPADASTEMQLMLERALRKTSPDVAANTRQGLRARTTGPIAEEARAGMVAMRPEGEGGLVATQQAMLNRNRQAVDALYDEVRSTPVATRLTQDDIQRAIFNSTDNPTYQRAVEMIAGGNASTARGPVNASQLIQIDKAMTEIKRQVRMGARTDLLLEDVTRHQEMFRDALEDILPGYDRARKAAQAAFQAEEGFDLGKSWPQRAAEDLAAQIESLSPPAQEAFRNAAAGRLFSDFSQALNKQSVSNKALGTFLDKVRGQDQKLRAIFGDAADDFIRSLAPLQEQSKTARTIINSSQADRPDSAWEVFKGQFSTAFSYLINNMAGAAGRTVIQSMMRNPVAERQVSDAIADILSSPSGFSELRNFNPSVMDPRALGGPTRGILPGLAGPQTGGLLGTNRRQ